MSDTARVTIDAKAKELLDEMAAAEGISSRQYLEALLHYAGSCYRRPGSWEGRLPFKYANYDTRHEDGQFADRWF